MVALSHIFTSGGLKTAGFRCRVSPPCPTPPASSPPAFYRESPKRFEPFDDLRSGHLRCREEPGGDFDIAAFGIPGATREAVVTAASEDRIGLAHAPKERHAIQCGRVPRIHRGP